MHITSISAIVLAVASGVTANYDGGLHAREAEAAAYEDDLYESLYARDADAAAYEDDLYKLLYAR